MLQDLTATISNTGQPKAANVAATFVGGLGRLVLSFVFSSLQV